MRNILRRTTRVIPTIYDDSLSYYEALCKMGGAIEEMQNILDGGIVDYIKENLGELIYQATYNKDRECIIFGFETIQTGEDVHYYRANDKTLYITKEDE